MVGYLGVSHREGKETDVVGKEKEGIGIGKPCSQEGAKDPLGQLLWRS